MVRAIFSKWPHLKKDIGNENDAVILWKEKLRTFFKNSRKRALNVPEIMERKKRCKKNIDGWNLDAVGKMKGRYTSWGVPNFLPPFEDGEDIETMKAHSEKIRKESRITKERRNNEMIEQLMNITFPHRRQMLITDMEKLGTVLEMYPVLNSEEQV